MATPLAQARRSVRELIRDHERRMYPSSYEDACYQKLLVIRRALYQRGPRNG